MYYEALKVLLSVVYVYPLHYVCARTESAKDNRFQLQLLTGNNEYTNKVKILDAIALIQCIFGCLTL
jgi:hypothetical protein